MAQCPHLSNPSFSTCSSPKSLYLPVFTSQRHGPALATWGVPIHPTLKIPTSLPTDFPNPLMQRCHLLSVPSDNPVHYCAKEIIADILVVHMGLYSPQMLTLLGQKQYFLSLYSKHVHNAWQTRCWVNASWQTEWINKWKKFSGYYLLKNMRHSI